MNTGSNRSILATVTILVAILSGGCSHLREGGGGSPDPASGQYEGHWYGPNAQQPLGELDCTITRRDADTWDATFAATFGGFGEYDVAMEGRREGDTVVFGGSIDLGETSGGVFDWTGQIEGNQFNGAYTSKFINGTFRMTRVADGSADQ